MRQHVNQQH
jgi:hypothetical protein